MASWLSRDVSTGSLLRFLGSQGLQEGGSDEVKERKLRLALAGVLLLLATALLATIVFEEGAEQLVPADLLKTSQMTLSWKSSNPSLWASSKNQGFKGAAVPAVHNSRKLGTFEAAEEQSNHMSRVAETKELAAEASKL